MANILQIHNASIELEECIVQRTKDLGLPSVSDYLTQLVRADITPAIKSCQLVPLAHISPISAKALLSKWGDVTEENIHEVLDFNRSYTAQEIYNRIQELRPDLGMPMYKRLSTGVHRSFGLTFRRIPCVLNTLKRDDSVRHSTNLYYLIAR